MRRILAQGTRTTSMDSCYPSDSRGDIPVGTFGAIRRWSCEQCGPLDEEPGYKVTHRQTMECPEEGVDECPDCGGLDICHRHDGYDDHDWFFKTVSRRTVCLRVTKPFTNLTGAQRGNEIQF